MDKFSKFIDYIPSIEGKKYTSYKTMKCYKLVFNFKYFIKNAGSIIVLIFLIAYVLLVIYYLMKGVSPLKLLMTKNKLVKLDDDYPKINTIEPFMYLEKKSKASKNKKKNLESKSAKQPSKKGFPKNNIKDSKNDLLNPPRRSLANKVGMSNGEKKKDPEHMKLIDLLKKNKKKGFGKIQKTNNIRIEKTGHAKIDYNLYTKKPRKQDFDLESMKSDKVRKRKTIMDYAKEIRNKKEKIHNENSDDKLFGKNKIKDKDKEVNTEIFKYKKKENENEKSNEELDDYELNHLPYEEAQEKDKRGFCKIYWSIIKRDELMLLTFTQWNDYNLFYVKLERFCFTILNLMAMNAFLFADKTIHKFFLDGVKYNFVQQILQIVLSIIITHVLEIILCFLSLTDRYIYEIKAVFKNNKDKSIMFDILKKVKNLLTIFFISLFLVSIFYWYFISAFCAVYNNTQGMYLIDCVLSFVFFSIDPFIIYALIALIRFIALKKKVKCLYSIGRIFPIF